MQKTADAFAASARTIFIIVLLDKIQAYYKTNESRYFVIYVHNLPFEFSFMIG